MGSDREGMYGEFWGGGQNFAFRQVWWSYRSLPNYGSLICTFVLCVFFLVHHWFALSALEFYLVATQL